MEVVMWWLVYLHFSAWDGVMTQKEVVGFYDTKKECIEVRDRLSLNKTSRSQYLCTKYGRAIRVMED
jgi:hypothetical protein